MVKYHNELNSIVMHKWTSVDFDLFFAILAKIKDKDVREYSFEYSEIRSLIGYDSSQSKQKFNAYVSNFAKKVSTIYYYEIDKNQDEDIILLFSKLSPKVSEQTLVVKLNEDYGYILNKLTKNFTIFELAEFVSLSSTYSKTMYRLLKQWRTVGKKRFKKEDLFMLLDVPKSTQAPRHFNARVLTPIKAELTPLFIGLKIEPVRAKTQGRPITHYEFTWQAETPGTWIEGKYDKPKYTPKTKQKTVKEVPDWLDNTSALQQPADPEKTKQIQEKLTLLFGNSD